MNDTDKWTEAEAKHYQATARQCLNQHSYKHESLDPLNCMACALRDISQGAIGPNVAGWARIFVEAQMPIPSQWKKAFEQQRKSPNKLYAQALARSIATFGEPDFC